MNFFVKSENATSEYCCTIVKINKITPIPESDFLGVTNIFNTPIVVRKDEVQEGDIMVYAPNESELNHDYLAYHNLFEISCREKNRNSSEVDKIMEEYEPYREEIDSIRNKEKKIKDTIKKKNKTIEKNKKTIIKLQKKGETEEILNEINELKAQNDKCLEYNMSNASVLVNLKEERTKKVEAGKHIIDKAKKLCGYFNEYGRVRCLTLKGQNSFGVLLSTNSLVSFIPSLSTVNFEDYVNTDFDTIDNIPFVKAYMPRVKAKIQRPSNRKEKQRNKRLALFDRVLNGQFAFHYDTEQLKKHLDKITPDTNIVFSVKMHGTSMVAGKLLVRNPKENFNPLKKCWNRIVRAIGLDKYSFTDFFIDYGPVFSSRKVILNQYINPNVGYRNGVELENKYKGIQNIIYSWSNSMYEYLDNGMTIYGEICGYDETSQPIQKTYDYGCKEGESVLMIYRITTKEIKTDDTGQEKMYTKEWEVEDVRKWTEELVEKLRNTTLEGKVIPIPVLYQGRVCDLYPDIDYTSNNWKDEWYSRLSKDKAYYMELNEPMCTYHEVPREGIVVRICNDELKEAFKVKTESFAFGEALRIDAGEVDDEMAETYMKEFDEE